MKVVLDTNVLVSAFLKPGSVPDLVVQRAIRGELTAVFDQRMLAEYVEVLSRPKFSFDRKETFRVLLRLITTGERSHPGTLANVVLRDPDDLPFAEVAVSSGAVIVTGNARDFAEVRSTRVLSPRELLEELGPERVVVRALPYNIEQRFDGDWARVDDNVMGPGTIREWEQHCADKGLKLVIERDERKPWDPYESALENMTRSKPSFRALCRRIRARLPIAKDSVMTSCSPSHGLFPSRGSFRGSRVYSACCTRSHRSVDAATSSLRRRSLERSQRSSLGEATRSSNGIFAAIVEGNFATGASAEP